MLSGSKYIQTTPLAEGQARIAHLKQFDINEKNKSRAPRLFVNTKNQPYILNNGKKTRINSKFPFNKLQQSLLSTHRVKTVYRKPSSFITKNLHSIPSIFKFTDFKTAMKSHVEHIKSEIGVDIAKEVERYQKYVSGFTDPLGTWTKPEKPTIKETQTEVKKEGIPQDIPLEGIPEEDIPQDIPLEDIPEEVKQEDTEKLSEEEKKTRGIINNVLAGFEDDRTKSLRSLLFQFIPVINSIQDIIVKKEEKSEGIKYIVDSVYSRMIHILLYFYENINIVEKPVETIKYSMHQLFGGSPSASVIMKIYNLKSRESISTMKENTIKLINQLSDLSQQNQPLRKPSPAGPQRIPSLSHPRRIPSASSTSSSTESTYSTKDPAGDGKGSGGGLYGSQINQLMRNEPNYKGVYASDQIQNVPINKNAPTSFIMNTDKEKGDGKHWQSVYMDPYNLKSIDFYDSFGRPPTTDFLKRMKGVVRKMNVPYLLSVKHNELIHQGGSQLCGYHAVNYLKQRNAGISHAKSTGFRALRKNISEKREEQMEKEKKFNFM